jgi:hypothetical protein
MLLSGVRETGDLDGIVIVRHFRVFLSFSLSELIIICGW